jgi:hypothetical protein
MDGFSFSEGQLWLWTGVNPSSAIAYVENTNVNITKGVANPQSVNGTYYNTVTGQRVDVSFSLVFTPDMALFRMFDSPTAVHMKLDHQYNGMSAGMILYSGIFDSFAINGNQGGMFTTPLRYHANIWSAYGR